jgi:hypothetical protein
VHEGRLDEDTQPGEEVEPQQDDMRIQSQASREVRSLFWVLRSLFGHSGYSSYGVLTLRLYVLVPWRFSSLGWLPMTQCS